MSNVRVIDAISPEALQAKDILLDCFNVDLNDPGAVDHFVGYIDTADVIAVASLPENQATLGGVALMSADVKPDNFRIDFLGVTTIARGKGLASALIGFCESHASSLGGRRILIESTAHEKGHKLYVGLGYLTDSLPYEVATERMIPFYKDL